MQPVAHPTNNMQLGAPVDWDQSKGSCEPLGVTLAEVEGLRCMASYWQPDEAERAALAQGKPVILFVYSLSHPVVALGVEA